jgi:hypothetical protein
VRHIGNDHVHIVWNEHYRDYKKLVPGDFGNCAIIITPLPCGAFGVDILIDEKVEIV